jgi:hypothetical protein
MAAPARRVFARAKLAPLVPREALQVAAPGMLRSKSPPQAQSM